MVWTPFSPRIENEIFLQLVVKTLDEPWKKTHLKPQETLEFRMLKPKKCSSHDNFLLIARKKIMEATSSHLYDTTSILTETDGIIAIYLSFFYGKVFWSFKLKSVVKQKLANHILQIKMVLKKTSGKKEKEWRFLLFISSLTRITQQNFWRIYRNKLLPSIFLLKPRFFCGLQLSRAKIEKI